MSGCSCHVETIAPLVMMSNYQNEAEIRDHVFGKEPLRPPPAARSRAQLYANGDPLSPRHGLESPCHVARAFQPVGLGRAVRSVLRPPSSAHRYAPFGTSTERFRQMDRARWRLISLCRGTASFRPVAGLTQIE